MGSKSVKLKSNERFIAEFDGMYWDDNIAHTSDSGTIVITDKRIILEWSKTHLFKPAEYFSTEYPLISATEIKVTKNPPKKKDSADYCECIITFKNGSIEVRKYATGYEEFRRFVNCVNQEITGSEEDIVGEQKTIFSGIAGTLASATREFTQAFGIGGSQQPAAAATSAISKISQPCSGCGATLYGRKGATVACEYCCATRQL